MFKNAIRKSQLLDKVFKNVCTNTSDVNQSVRNVLIYETSLITANCFYLQYSAESTQLKDKLWIIILAHWYNFVFILLFCSEQLFPFRAMIFQVIFTRHSLNGSKFNTNQLQYSSSALCILVNKWKIYFERK